ncbi:hypothetical protein A2757_03790 [Candidatus Giovannonibacteria bacterium RIFCSPHIGHO2_01_FULL_48_47]|nr:MAG: hypothetical protein A2757_03790 [Candidatus Giovannonibacteria bacterium RIFCSPHIGHO2_01_FULL_48_47]OGF68723.1 MAG: hypothetical protein A3D61_01375 [Candidatus Giovannonibacteria bacterium RIFCSPHIGHO2_02_FULL_48_15]OGF89639.1 MAG: hypothetical protein A3B26_02800 [Candidatus Giovannonibacteria bacterium RIFCSPLOWO2_01_FULL_48_47]OGF95077.1 MAG: hypothetical protein A2433_01855 [Candidatus Giovannonibacteria bacterium RIFOXYC1_FULL_48_8]OGF96344.1 MAG: hypothetical protein A2613_02165
MRFHYDKKIDALYIRFNEKRYAESDEVKKGVIFDYDKAGKIIGIEVLDASKRFPREFSSKFQKKKIPVALDFVQAPAPVR